MTTTTTTNQYATAITQIQGAVEQRQESQDEFEHFLQCAKAKFEQLQKRDTDLCQQAADLLAEINAPVHVVVSEPEPVTYQHGNGALPYQSPHNRILKYPVTDDDDRDDDVDDTPPDDPTEELISDTLASIERECEGKANVMGKIRAAGKVLGGDIRSKADLVAGCQRWCTLQDVADIVKFTEAVFHIVGTDLPK